MSGLTDRRPRTGAALLLAIVIIAITSVCVIALWRSVAGLQRARVLERAMVASTVLGDSAMLRGLALLDATPWRLVPQPGDIATLASGAAPRGGTWRVSIGRSGWNSLLLRSLAALPSGVRGVAAASDRRTLIPLRTAMPMPTAALTGEVAWLIDSSTVVELPAPPDSERVCRPAEGLRTTATAAFPPAFDFTRYPAVDPDTVTDSLVGAFRLTRSRLSVPLRVTGMVVLDSELFLEADLRLTGVLIARGSIRHVSGHLMVTGAVVAGDAGGGHSGLGPGDRVRYDACAIRRAVEHVTSPGPAATWTHLTPF